MNQLALTTRIERLVGKPVASLQAIQRGYTPALRLRVTLVDGSFVFVKTATTPLTARWLRKEAFVYSFLKGSFMPERLGWEDDHQSPLLILEDLSAADWPPPWSPVKIQGILEALSRIASYPLESQIRAKLPRIEEDSEIPLGWQPVAEDPAPFLSLGLASDRWLAAALPRLLQVDGRKLFHGEALLHLDVRSDNLCFLGERVVLVDWNWARRGNPICDVAFWLPSLENEGGPRPESILPNAGEFAAVISGFFASKAGLPPILDAPFVRRVQLEQLRSALPWAVRALGLPPLNLS
jgi:hypothetical protein